MKKYYLMLIFVVIVTIFTGCNDNVVTADTIIFPYFDKAIIKLPDDTCITVDVYEFSTGTDNITILTESGVMYRTSYINVLLYTEVENETTKETDL